MNISGIGASPIYQRNSFGKTSLINSEGYDSRTYVEKTTTKVENEPMEQLNVLTTDQKKELMEKYDIKNMKFGSKEHREFMGELVKMGAISQEDYDNTFNTTRRCSDNDIQRMTDQNGIYSIKYFDGRTEIVSKEKYDSIFDFEFGISEGASMYRMFEVSYDGYMGMYKNVLKDSYEKGILPDDEYMKRAESNKRVFDVIQSIFE